LLQSKDASFRTLISK